MKRQATKWQKYFQATHLTNDSYHKYMKNFEKLNSERQTKNKQKNQPNQKMGRGYEKTF